MGVMNEALATLHARAIHRWLGPRGRLLGYQQTTVLTPSSDHLVEFNAGVWFEGGQVWWGDLDLTIDEPFLAALAAETGETVSLVWGDGELGRLGGAPKLGRAVYRVTPLGAVWYATPIIERLTDRRLVVRGVRRDTRRGLPARPEMWRFWRLGMRLERWAGPRETDGYRGLRLLVGGSGIDGYPYLAVQCALFRNVARGGWVQIEWFPSASQRSWAPAFGTVLRWPRGPVRPWVSIRVDSGTHDWVQAGLVIGPRDPRWG